MDERLVCRGVVPEVYLRSLPGRDRLDEAFAAAFGAPRPAVFDAEEQAFLDVLAVQPVARVHWVARHGLSARLDIYLMAEIDAVPPLRDLAARLGQPLLVDIGHDIADDTSLLVPPDGRVVRGDFADLAAHMLRQAGGPVAPAG